MVKARELAVACNASKRRDFTRRKLRIRSDSHCKRRLISILLLVKMSSLTLSSSSWALPAVPAFPETTDEGFTGYIFKWAAHRWRVHERSANKRGPSSWIWHHGSELWEAKDLSQRRHIGCAIAAGTEAPRPCYRAYEGRPRMEQ